MTQTELAVPAGLLRIILEDPPKRVLVHLDKDRWNAGYLLLWILTPDGWFGLVNLEAGDAAWRHAMDLRLSSGQPSS